MTNLSHTWPHSFYTAGSKSGHSRFDVGGDQNSRESSDYRL